MRVQGDQAPNYGKIRWVSRDGYGFITPESGKDLYFHRSQFLADEFEDLRGGDEVKYATEQRRGQPVAVRVIRRFPLIASERVADGRHQTQPDECVFLLAEDGRFRSLPCTRGPTGNVIIDGGDLASVLTDSSLPSLPGSRSGLWKACTEFERLINEPSVPESALQEFFEAHPEFLLADKFEAMYPQVVLPIDSEGAQFRPDFILRPFAGVSYEPEIVELKLPRQPVAKLSSSRTGLYAPIHGAVDQLRSYARVFEDERRRGEIARRLGFTTHRPTLALIVGRTRDLPQSRRTALMRERIEPVQLRTYDDVLLQFRKRAGLD